MSTIAFDIIARTANAVRGIRQVGDETDRTGSRLHRLSSGAKVALAGAGVAIVGFGKSSIDAYADAETSQRKLTDAYARFPALADVSIKALQDQGAALQRKTKFDGDDINASQAVLAQYKLTGSQLQKLTPLLLDYAEKTGKDLPSAAEDFGKAMLGQGKGLKSIGLNFKDAGSPAANFDQLMKGVRTQVGGFAEGEGKSAAGQAAILGNNFGDVQEQVGSKLLPIMTKLTKVMIATLDWAQRNSTVVKVLASVLGGVALAYGVATLAVRAQTAATTIARGATLLWSGVTKAAAAAQWLLNAAMSANPFVLIIGLLIAVGAGLYLLWTKSETFRTIVKGAFDAVKTAASLMWSGIQTVFGAIGTAFMTLVRLAYTIFVQPMIEAFAWILRGAATAFGWIPGLGGKLKGASRAFDTFKAEVNQKLSLIPSSKGIKINADGSQALGVISTVASRLRALTSSNALAEFNKGKLPGGGALYGPVVRSGARALGGPVMKGMPYVVGERRRELFVPDSNGTIIPEIPMAGPGGGQSVVNQITVQTPQVWAGTTLELGRAIAAQLEGYVQAGGQLKIARAVIA